VSKWKVKLTNFSRRLKQFDGLTGLTPTAFPYFTADLRVCLANRISAVKLLASMPFSQRLPLIFTNKVVN